MDLTTSDSLLKIAMTFSEESHMSPMLTTTYENAYFQRSICSFGFYIALGFPISSINFEK
jgi:hypothetical protein